MEIFLKIKRKNVRLYCKATETTSVLELKTLIEGILQVPSNIQQLFNMERQLMEDDKPLQDYGFNSLDATGEDPGVIVLAFRQDSGDFELLECNLPELIVYATPDFPHQFLPD